MVASSPDAEVMEDAALDHVRERLMHACREHETLDLALMALDPELSDSLRRRVVRLLATRSADDEAIAHLSRVLYAAPLPVSEGLPRAIELAGACSPRLERFFVHLADSQPAIGRVRETWNRVSAGVFPSPSAARAIEVRAVREGTFRRLVDWLQSSEEDRASVSLRAEEFAWAPGLPALLDAWMTELAGSPPPLDAKPAGSVTTAPATAERGPRVVVVPDEAREEYRELLESHGYVVAPPQGGTSSDEGRRDPADVLLVGTTLRDVWKRVDDFRIRMPRTRIVVLGGETVTDALRAMQAGADDYLARPFPPELLLAALQKAAGQAVALGESAREGEYPYGIIGASEAIRDVAVLVQRAARTDASVFISGEGGTGKTQIARAIHDAGARTAGPFVSVNCAAFPDQVLEIELFGRVKDIFTGVLDWEGRLHSASGGTLFLDEIQEMGAGLQRKLLHVLHQAKAGTPDAGTGVPVDVRWIASSSRDPETEVRQGRLRRDLLESLSAFAIRVPPLRERRADIPLLARHFLQKTAAGIGRPSATLTGAAIRTLLAYDWPGNIRQLQNVIERAAILNAGDVITPRDLPLPLRPHEQYPTLTLTKVEARHIERVLRLSAGNAALAAEILGISRAALQWKLNSLGLLKMTGE